MSDAGSPATFTSTNLGISFNYLPAVDGYKVGVLEQPDRVYVYVGDIAPTSGQYAQIYHKPATQSLTDAIQAQVLAGYSPQDCLVQTAQNPETGQTWPPTYSFARIAIPQAPGDTMESLAAKARKCPQPYAAIGGLAYFLADSQHPDRFVFLSIGQYGIPASRTGDTVRPWQVTLRFLDAAGVAPQPPEATYIDDRSGPEGLLASYFSAINLYQYPHAFSYWRGGVAPFAQFQAGYANTRSVRYSLGTIRSGAARPALLLRSGNVGRTE